MTALYAITLIVGIVGLLVWVGRAAVADTVDGWAAFDPDRRFGRRARLGVAATLGFGLAGMSSRFAGWPTALTLVAAVGGAAVIAAVAHRYGPEPSTGAVSDTDLGPA